MTYIYTNFIRYVYKLEKIYLKRMNAVSRVFKFKIECVIIYKVIKKWLQLATRNSNVEKSNKIYLIKNNHYQKTMQQ